MFVGHALALASKIEPEVFLLLWATWVDRHRVPRVAKGAA